MSEYFDLQIVWYTGFSQGSSIQLFFKIFGATAVANRTADARQGPKKFWKKLVSNYMYSEVMLLRNSLFVEQEIRPDNGRLDEASSCKRPFVKKT